MAAEKTETRNTAFDRFKVDPAGLAVGGRASVRDSEDMGTEGRFLRRNRPRPAPAPSASTRSQQSATSTQKRLALFPDVLSHPRSDTSRVGLPYGAFPTRLPCRRSRFLTSFALVRRRSFTGVTYELSS